MRRRDFLRTTGGGLAGSLVVPRWTRAAPPSEQIVMGHIGVGGMGSGHVDWFLGSPQARVIAVCDVDEANVKRNVQKVHDRYKNTECTGYRDFRQVLDRTDIDAISTATPDHWRAMIVTHAFMAGKDVYAEKPLCHNYLEAQAMLRLGQRYKRVYQLGTQIHAGDNYHRVVELVRSGILGKIHTIRVWSSGGAGVIQPTPNAKVPETLDYDMWLGPAPWRPYDPGHVHFRFRYFLDFSCGHYADFWCHISDIAFWAADIATTPKTITARGALQDQGIADAPRTIDVDLEFPDGLKYFWTTPPPQVPEAMGWGMACIFYGTQGALTCNYGERVIFLGNEKLKDIDSVPRSLPRSPGHHVNFLQCIKTRELTESNLPYVVNMTTPMFFGRISLLLGGRTLHWDESKKQFTGDDEANRLLGRVYRQPWTLPA